MSSISVDPKQMAELDPDQENIGGARIEKVARSKETICLIPFRSQHYILLSPVSEKMCLLLSETLKILFSQTVNWKEEVAYDKVRTYVCVGMIWYNKSCLKTTEVSRHFHEQKCQVHVGDTTVVTWQGCM